MVEFGQGYIQEQRQTHAISQMQREKLAILAMNAQELNDFLSNEQMENPMIDLDEPDSRQEMIRAGEWMRRNGDSEVRDSYSGYIEEDDGRHAQEFSTRHGESLGDYLRTQIPSRTLDGRICRLVEILLEFIDEDTGYFTEPRESLMKLRGYEKAEKERAIELIRTMDPVGTGAFDLPDCLLIQLRRAGIRDETLFEIIDSYMQEVAGGKISVISRSLNISTEKVKRYIYAIRNLNPRPAKGFGKDRPVYIIPDMRAVFIHGTWQIIFFGRTAKDIRLNRLYMEIAKQADEPEIAEYLENKIKRARFIVQSVEQREETVRKVAVNALTHQAAYVLGNGKKQVLTMRQTAGELGIHPSTVTRAVKDKYIETPRGTLLLKDLFILKEEKTDHPKKDKESEVIDRIAALIQKEDKKLPLSDQKITDLLKEDGIVIARRTVAKYREMAGIVKASERKRL